MFTSGRCPRAIASGTTLIFRKGVAYRGGLGALNQMTRVSCEVTGRISLTRIKFQTAGISYLLGLETGRRIVLRPNGFSRVVRYALAFAVACAISLLAAYAFNVSPP